MPGILRQCAFWQTSIALAIATLAGCATVPKGRFGVDDVEVQGAEQLSPEAVKRCMLTEGRPRARLTLGSAPSGCNEPPFDSEPPTLSLWHSLGVDWPGLDPTVLEVDRNRIERFYRARGFYDARVLQFRYAPPYAGDLDGDVPEGQCDPDAPDAECTATVTVVLEEGEPLTIGSLRIDGDDDLPAATRELLAEVSRPAVGERFDELHYDSTKQALLEALWESGYADAEVNGEVVLDHGAGTAAVTITLQPGPVYRFGRVDVDGQGQLPTAPIVAAAGVEPGAVYRRSAEREAQTEVYALGAFRGVEVERTLDRDAHEVHLRLRVTPLPYDAFRIGVGITSGALRRTESGTLQSVPQWDLHLLARYERRHVFGTLGKLRIEERPRMIFQRPFPEPSRQQPGNVVKVRLSEPGLVEARTEVSAELTWDYGPDAFLGFLRSDVAVRLAAERFFLRRHLHAVLALQQDRFIVANGTQTTDGSDLPGTYLFTFIEQELRLDLRDDAVRPTQGGQLLLNTAASVRNPYSDWTSLRVEPDARAYLPLPLQLVLAMRFAVGALIISDARGSLDDNSYALGPTTYRLRGGGAQGNRGFVAGTLGAGRQGGLRRWESSVELRARVGENAGVVLFYDMGDVNRAARFRFQQTNPSAGFGIRYLTPVGALRSDIGFQLDPADGAGRIFGTPGAWHFTIGEAF